MEWYGLINLAQDRDQEGSCEHGIELLVFLKCSEILEWLSDWRFLKKDSASWS
jgi:hypothetical protein